MRPDYNRPRALQGRPPKKRYRKNPIISPGAYFWSKGLFTNFFLGGGVLYMDEYLRLENVIFCSSNCNFFNFSAHDLSLLLIFLLYYFQ